MSNRFLQRLREKVIVFDGAMGTTIQACGLSLDDFQGLDGCNEFLCITRPDIIKQVHASFFEVGADIVETNSFGSSSIVLAEYDIAGRAYEISRKSAELAREVADQFSTDAWPRFVSGSVGPGTKLITLGHISFEQMFKSLEEQILGLVDGGVDLIQIETCQDILQLKCAVNAARSVMRKTGKQIPICTQITIETSGTMLIGTEVSAALVVCESLPIDIVGMNCATGPDLMQEYARFLGSASSRPVSVLPNAGLPRNVEGKVVYDLSAEALADYLEIFVRDYGVALVGGCCGTTPEHIKAVYDRVGGLSPLKRPADFASHLSSSYSAVTLDQESSALIVGERCNANGSKAFREMLLKQDWDGIVEMAREEVKEGAHILDLCTAYVGRDEKHDMTEILSRFATQITAPIMIDSTQLDVMEEALKRLGGRSIINSINLEDGEEKFDKICRLAVEFGAALVALTIDEQGMAKTAERKLEVAQRIHDLCHKRHGIPSEAIIYDPLTFTIGSGDEDSRKAGIETLEAIKLIKAHVPRARTILGLSNISFGLKPHARQILNSVYLSEARKAGLDACIVHSKKILPLNKIPEQLLKTVLDLIYDRRSTGYDPLFKLLEQVEGVESQVASADESEEQPIADLLKRRIIDGRKVGIEALLDRALKQHSPVEIINTILLDGMKVVGDLFGSGEMQLPFVLQSAETMKHAVSYLERFMDKVAGPARGTMVIATVKGDVHDIGKNLVDIILSNNGYKVVNLGIKQPLDTIIEAAKQHNADVIGMSGLLVKSTWIMKENLEQMSKEGLKIPVICGGAALNRSYVEVDLRQAYTTGDVFYGSDAFSGLHIMNELCGLESDKKLTQKVEVEKVRRAETRAEREKRQCAKSREYFKSDVSQQTEIPTPPFWGSRVVGPEQLDLSEIFTFINKKALYANQWMYRRGKRSTKDYREFIKNHVDPMFYLWCQRAIERNWLEPKLVYGYFKCQSEQNDLIVYSEQEQELCRISLPRQVQDRRLCIADYFLPKSSGRFDVVAFHVVTIGEIASTMCQELFQNDQYTDYLHFYGLSVETAEALAEYWHKRIRAELSISAKDGATVDMLFRQGYHGSRYSFGYPACPNLEDQRHIFKLLEPERIGMSLTSEYQLVPEQSTSAIIVHHPDAHYFSI